MDPYIETYVIPGIITFIGSIIFALCHIKKEYRKSCFCFLRLSLAAFIPVVNVFMAAFYIIAFVGVILIGPIAENDSKKDVTTSNHSKPNTTGNSKVLQYTPKVRL